MGERVRLGIVGASWWADAMYLPALTRHPLADVRALVGGTRVEVARELAARWSVPAVHDSVEAMLAAEPLDALLILTPNAAHYAHAMTALEHGLHVLCEKPLAMTSAEARRLAEAAETAGVVTMTPFTYRFMPSTRYAKELLDEGFIGRPYHLNLRYYADYGRAGDYMWRFDLQRAGAGTAGDLGSHLAYLARWFFGEITAVTAVLGHAVPREARPDGSDYPVGEDSGMILLEFASGATGSLHVSSVAHEPSAFGQLQQFELHGSDGTLHVLNDWDHVERVSGARSGERPIRELPIPDRIWGTARRDPVTDTYRDTFRDHDHMARAFVTAIAEGHAASPDFRDGLAVQRVVDAALRSGREGRRVTIAEIVTGEA